MAAVPVEDYGLSYAKNNRLCSGMRDGQGEAWRHPLSAGQQGLEDLAAPAYRGVAVNPIPFHHIGAILEVLECASAVAASF